MYLSPKETEAGGKGRNYLSIIDLPIKGGLGSQFYCNLGALGTLDIYM